MKSWQETAAILALLEKTAAAGKRAALAVLTHIEGSAYRRPGAKFLVDEEGATLGSVSGGCLEEDVRQNALAVIESGEPRRLHYDTGSDDESVWGLGLGCNGSVDLLVHVASGLAYRDVAEAVRRLLRGNDVFAIATLTDGEGAGGALVTSGRGIEAGGWGEPDLEAAMLDFTTTAFQRGRSTTLEIEGREVFVEVLTPPPYLLVFGAGDDAIPLVELAAEAGFRVVVVDHRAGYLAAERFPSAWERQRMDPDEAPGQLPTGINAFAVVKTHSLLRDGAWARALLATQVPYIGLLGPRDRRDEIVAQLDSSGLQRIYGPVGLDLGAEGPEQVAFSIIAELLAVRSGRTPAHLRETAGPIHARE